MRAPSLLVMFGFTVLLAGATACGNSGNSLSGGSGDGGPTSTSGGDSGAGGPETDGGAGGVNSGGDGTCGATLTVAPTQRLAINAGSTTVSSTSQMVVEGPRTLRTWSNGCVVDCDGIPGGCNDQTVPECEFWVSNTDCTSDASAVLIIDDLFPQAMGGAAIGSGILYEGFPLAADEMLCMSVKNGAIGGVEGWAASAAPGAPAVGTKGRTPFRTSFSNGTAAGSSAPVVSGPTTLQALDFDCECAGTTESCVPGPTVPECDFWLSPTSSCDDPTKATFSFGTSFPLGTEDVVTPFPGFPLADGETVCATAKNLGLATVSGWGWGGGASDGSGAGTPAYPPTDVSRRRAFNVDTSSSMPVISGPVTLETIDATCDAACSSETPDCTGRTPGCTYWISTMNCQDTPPGAFVLAYDFPLGETLGDLSLYDGYPLEAGETLCASARDTAIANVVGWATQSTAPDLIAVCQAPAVSSPASRLPVDFSLYGATASSQTVMSGPATVTALSYVCTEACSTSTVGCGSSTPSCELWLGNEDCSGPASHTSFSHAYPLGSSDGEALSWPGFPLEAGESICVTANEQATVDVFGWGVSGVPAGVQDRRVYGSDFSSATSSTQEVLEGPTVLHEIGYTCTAACESTDPGCSAYVPECDVWLSTHDCQDPQTPSFTFDTIFPEGDVSLGKVDAGDQYRNISLATGESLCVTTKDSGTLHLNAWTSTP